MLFAHLLVVLHLAHDTSHSTRTVTKVTTNLLTPTRKGFRLQTNLKTLSGVVLGINRQGKTGTQTAAMLGLPLWQAVLGEVRLFLRGGTALGMTAAVDWRG